VFTQLVHVDFNPMKLLGGKILVVSGVLQHIFQQWIIMW